MTAVLLIAGLAVGVLALGHCFLGMIFNLPFEGVQRGTYWALVAVAIFFWFAAWLSQQITMNGVSA